MLWNKLGRDLSWPVRVQGTNSRRFRRDMPRSEWPWSFARVVTQPWALTGQPCSTWIHGDTLYALHERINSQPAAAATAAS